jgi:hypothetical protein
MRQCYRDFCFDLFGLARDLVQTEQCDAAAPATQAGS